MYQTAPSIWTIGRDKPVILEVPFLSHTSPNKRLRGVARPNFHFCDFCCASHSQVSFCPRTHLQISNLDELTIQALPISFRQGAAPAKLPACWCPLSGEQLKGIWVVLHYCRSSYLLYAYPFKLQQQVAVKVYKVFTSHQATLAFSPVSEFRRTQLGTVTTSLNHSCTSPFR